MGKITRARVAIFGGISRSQKCCRLRFRRNAPRWIQFRLWCAHGRSSEAWATRKSRFADAPPNRGAGTRAPPRHRSPKQKTAATARTHDSCEQRVPSFSIFGRKKFKRSGGSPLTEHLVDAVMRQLEEEEGVAHTNQVGAAFHGDLQKSLVMPIERMSNDGPPVPSRRMVSNISRACSKTGRASSGFSESGAMTSSREPECRGTPR